MPDETANSQWRVRRRTFLKTAGLTAAAGALAGCHTPETILPLLEPDARAPEGRPQYFATTCRECPAGCGMVVRVNDGRPTKAEGNPDHPVNRGKLCMRGQSALQGLYNPDRFQGPMRRDATGRLRPVAWDEALTLWQRELDSGGRAGSVVWLGQLEAGTLSELIADWMAARGFAPPIPFEYFSYDALRSAQGELTGRGEVPSFHIDRARYLVSFGAEFLETWISNVEFARDFAAMHSYGHNPAGARFVAVGPRLNLSAANADEYWPARPGTEHLLAWALVDLLAADGLRPPAVRRPQPMPLSQVAETSGIDADVIRRAAGRLRDTHPSLVLGPGYGNDSRAAASCHLAAAALNRMLGNEGVTVDSTAPHALSRVAGRADMQQFLERARGGDIRLLLLHHANPVFHHPDLAPALERIPFIVSFASWMDETTRFAHLVLPDHHFLESWGDYAPTGAVSSILQPARIPVYDTRATGDLLLWSAAQSGLRLGAGLGPSPPPAVDLSPPPEGAFAAYLAARWQARLGGPDPQTAWESLLQRGLYQAQPGEATPGSAPPARTPPAMPPPDSDAAPARFDGDGEFYLAVFPSVQFFDGRQANRAWCQEIAEPLSKIVWDGWAELHPDTAARLKLSAGDIVRLHSPHGSAEFPLFITTWIRPDTVGVLLGQGHSDFGMFANGCGDNVQTLQSPLSGAAGGLWAAQAVKVSIQPTGRHRGLANLQPERLQRDKRIALAVERAEAGTAAAREPDQDASFYEHHPHPHHRWGMAIDLDSCIGCNACQAACYAENNIAVMGRSSCTSHREMTWIRVELWEGDAQHPSTALNPDLRFMPIPCQQCGNAPCEYVCPVFAAYHTDEGLNAQVYNRCIGTRYCSNNCIYKVRRFNWYTPQWPEPLEQQLNPDVTVRSKGVMEKCTFCVQRIAAAEIDASATGRPLAEIQTACMQTCPTDAIVFGDLKDPDSHVSQLARQPRAYGLFAAENTYPGVRYLKRAPFELNQAAGSVGASAVPEPGGERAAPQLAVAPAGGGLAAPPALPREAGE